MALAGLIMSLTAPLEVLYAAELAYGPLLMGAFMLASALGVIMIDLFGTRLVPALDARLCIAAALAFFGLACVGMAVAWTFEVLAVARVLQGFGGGLMLGGGLQAAVRVRPVADPAVALGRFSAAFLLGGAVGAPGGLLFAALVHGPTGYRLAFAVTGALAVVFAGVIVVSLPRLAAPAGTGRPQLGLPRFGRAPGTLPGFLLAMIGDFLRGGVLLTALPLAGASRGYPTEAIGLAIALISAVKITVLTVTSRLIARIGLVALLVCSLTIGLFCSVVLVLSESAIVYLTVSAAYGCALAGVTLGLPLMVMRMVGESAAGLARFRVSAGIGTLAGSAGCAVVGTAAGTGPLFALIALVLAGGVCLAHAVGRRLPAQA